MFDVTPAIAEAARRQIHDVRWVGDQKSRLFSLHIGVDPVHGIETLTVFADDGHGNGNGIFEIAMIDLSAGIVNELRRKFGEI